MDKPVVFLSASVPLADRDPAYYQSADVIAIREAVRELALVVASRGTIVFCGHSAIAPLIRLVARDYYYYARVGEHVITYQSAYFGTSVETAHPLRSVLFGRTEVIPAVGNDLAASLVAMRDRMLGDHIFDAGIFIGGMEGVEEDFALFRSRHPSAKVLPVASTGAAAKILYDREGPFPTDLETDLAYGPLFRRHLGL